MADPLSEQKPEMDEFVVRLAMEIAEAALRFKVTSSEGDGAARQRFDESLETLAAYVFTRNTFKAAGYPQFASPDENPYG